MNSDLRDIIINNQSLVRDIRENLLLSLIVILFTLTHVIATPTRASEFDANDSKVQNTTYQFKQLSISQGLIDNEILDLIQDKSGFIWIATSQGLIRYDGSSFVNYHHNVKNPDSLSINEITTVFEDHSGKLWVGTERGLNRQLDHTYKFKRYYHDQDNPNSLSDNKIVAIKQDEQQRVWVASETALHLFENETNTFVRYYFYDPISAENDTIRDIQTIGNNLFVAASSGLYQFVTEQNTFRRFDQANGLPNQEYQITTLYADSVDNLWVALEGFGLYQLMPDNDNFNELTQINQILKKEEQVSSISAIYHSLNDRNYWIGTKNHGLYVVSAIDGTVEKILQDKVDDFNIFENSEILGIFRDESGMFWIRSRQAGLMLWSSHTLGIEHFGANKGYQDETLLRSYIWFFYETPGNSIWVGTQRGLMKFNPDTQEYINVMMDGKPYEEQPAIYWITHEDNTLWLATSQGLIHYDIQNDTILDRLLDQPSQNALYSLHFSEDHLYIIIDEQGILVLDRDTKQPLDLAISNSGKYAELVKRSVAFITDEDGSLWILTREGLVNYDITNDKVRLTLTAGPDQLSSERVSALYQRGNEYWIGTTGNGINRLVVNDFDTGDYETTQFDQQDELAYLVVTGVLLDDLDEYRVWISTHSGLVMFDPNNNYIRRFQLSEGMQSLEYNEAAHYKDQNGILYFGGVNGFNRINPSKFNQSDYEPPLQITDITISCTEATSECLEAEERFKALIMCDQSEDYCNVLNTSLPSDLQSISINFSSLDFTLPENNVYRYRLRISDATPWTELDNVNQLTLSGLASGKYNLEIQGTNFAGQWSTDIASLSFVVERPWYYENYTFIILFLTIISSIYFFRESRLLRKQEHERIHQAIITNEENFKFALWGSGDEMWDWDIEHDVIRRSNPIKQIDFIEQENYILNMTEAFAKVHPEDISRVRAEMTDLINGELPFMESIFRLKSHGEGYLWVMCRARVVSRDDHKVATRALGSLKDITIMKATEDKLTLIAQAFENTKEGISVVDSNFIPIFNNKAVYDITGLDQVEAIHKQYFFAPDSQNYSLLNQVKTYLKNFSEWEGEIWERRIDGEEFAMSLKIDKVNDTPNSDDYYICVFSDITYSKRSEEELIRLANIDSLTGLPNRSLFLDRLSHAIAYARRNNTLFALLFIDLDNFKNINDTLGHSMGDKMLINISKRLKACVRDVDTVARLGGDEFTVILENIKSTNEVGLCANKILKRLSESMEIDGSLLKTTPSIGIGMYPAHGKDREMLLKNADLAMYSAKEKGRNNYQFFTEDMTSLAMERISIENKLRHAIEANQLTLFYQPKVYSVTGELTGFEALVRWIHPEDGMISPGAFIPVAEETGLILSLGDWILEEAIKQAKEWSHIAPECCQIAVNISAKQFMSDALPKRIAALLEQYELDPKYIELEITEGTLMENMNHTINSLNVLREMGLEISLDDFGTGYSSLSYLKEFPVNQLKIDQSFVRDVTTDPSDASIVASIITLAHNLGLNVVAEGCETIDQLKFLRAYHCEQVQGYLFSRPLPKLEAEAILKIGEINVE